MDCTKIQGMDCTLNKIMNFGDRTYWNMVEATINYIMQFLSQYDMHVIVVIKNLSHEHNIRAET